MDDFTKYYHCLDKNPRTHDCFDVAAAMDILRSKFVEPANGVNDRNHIVNALAGFLAWAYGVDHKESLEMAEHTIALLAEIRRPEPHIAEI